MTLNVTAFTGLGAGPHDVWVTDVSVKTAKAGGNYLRWEFRDADDHQASANTSEEMTPGNKTGKWFAALTNRPTVVGEQRHISEVIGKPASIFIEINAEGYPKVTGLTSRVPTVINRTATAEAIANSEATEQAKEQHAAQEGDELPF